MDVIGDWFVSFGEVPAPFVYPVTLHSNGVAEWLGGERGKQPWRLAGDTLFIGDGVEDLLMFDVGRAGSDWLSGVVRSFVVPAGADLEDDDTDTCFDDTAMLLRSPGDFEVRADSAEKLAELDEEREARQARAFAQHGEWGQLGFAIL